MELIEGAVIDMALQSEAHAVTLNLVESSYAWPSARGTKLALYARHAIPAYWIVNLVDGLLETYATAQAGTYQHQRVLQRGDTVKTGPAGVLIRVDDLLP